MKSVGVISFKPLLNDPRINRQVDWLKDDYDVFTVGPIESKIPGVDCVDCGLTSRSFLQKAYRASLLILGQFERFYWSTPHVQTSLYALRKKRPDLIIANELECLPLALKLKQEINCKVVFDAHEYYPEYRQAQSVLERAVNQYFYYLCQTYLLQPDLSTTVSDGIVKKYQEVFGASMELITNAPPHSALEPSSTQPERIRLIHHGFCMPDRYLEKNIELMQYLDPRFELNMMLMPDNPAYMAQLKQLAQPFKERIHFLEPVPMKKISEFIQQFDMGLFLLPPTHFNYRFALPNKFFEFLQGKLAIAIGPSPEMQRIVEQYRCGIVGTDFMPASLAEQLNKLTQADINRFKQQALKASRDLNAEVNGEQMRKWVSALLTTD